MDFESACMEYTGFELLDIIEVGPVRKGVLQSAPLKLGKGKTARVRMICDFSCRGVVRLE